MGSALSVVLSLVTTAIYYYRTRAIHASNTGLDMVGERSFVQYPGLGEISD